MDLILRNKIIELRAKGYSFSRISKELKIAKQTAIDECRRNEEKLSTLYALEWEELLEKHKITKEERLKAHASLLRKIRDEIESRSLDDISTDKLIDLYLKQSAALKEEIIEPVFKSSDEQERDKQEREYLNTVTNLEDWK